MIYELRTYDAHPGKLDDLSRRFADHTLTLFDRHGIKSVGYWTDAKDAASNRLTYLLAFESEEQYKAAWASFIADPDWKAVREETEADGPLVETISSTLLRPTDYSPLR